MSMAGVLMQYASVSKPVKETGLYPVLLLSHVDGEAMEMVSDFGDPVEYVHVRTVKFPRGAWEWDA